MEYRIQYYVYVGVSVSWIVNIMATTVLLYVHHCSLGDSTSMAPAQCRQSLLILRGIDYCLRRYKSTHWWNSLPPEAMCETFFCICVYSC